MNTRQIIAVVVLGIATVVAATWGITHPPEDDARRAQQPLVNHDVVQVKIRLRSADIDTVKAVTFPMPSIVSLEDCPEATSTSLQRCVYRLPKGSKKEEVHRFPDEAFVSIVYVYESRVELVH